MCRSSVTAQEENWLLVDRSTNDIVTRKLKGFKSTRTAQTAVAATVESWPIQKYLTYVGVSAVLMIGKHRNLPNSEWTVEQDRVKPVTKSNQADNNPSPGIL
jgi:hypothetical protein